MLEYKNNYDKYYNYEKNIHRANNESNDVACGFSQVWRICKWRSSLYIVRTTNYGVQELLWS